MDRSHVARLGLAAITILLVGAIAGVPTSLARYTESADSSGSFEADTLAPPTNLTASGGTSVGLTWAPTTDGYADGYELYRGSAAGGPYTLVGPVTPASASSTSDGPANGTWYYVLRSVFGSWSSADSNEASATVGPSSVTTAFATCTNNAADTTNAGDNNGYQGNPARACVDDGSAATDSNSGTGGTASCGSGSTPATTKDRHRFWGMAFGLPGSVTAIDGITVRADVGMNNNGGTTNVCVQLSWNGGTTWTTMQSAAINGTAQATYLFGSASSTWGRTWAVGDFGTSNFRVRVIDASSQNTKEFRLDYIAVSVTYRP
jgi:hypothetical protein